MTGVRRENQSVQAGGSMSRIILKLSGEALAGEKKTGFDLEIVERVAGQVKKLVDDGNASSKCSTRKRFR